MPSGYPDWHKGVKADIIAQTLDKIKVDIVSQTLAELGIDIKAQTIDKLGIDIKAQTLAELATGIRTYQAETVEFIEIRSDSTIPASGGYEYITVRAPTGYIYDLLGFQFEVLAPGGSTGRHSFRFLSESKYIEVLYGASNYGDSLKYKFGEWFSATAEYYPTDKTTQCNIIKGLRADENNGYRFEYVNGADADQTNVRVYLLWVRKIKVS